MMDYVCCNRLKVAASLHRFVEQQVLVGIPLAADLFWERCDALVHELAPLVRDLLVERERLQHALAHWHQAHAGKSVAPGDWHRHLQQIGYLQAVPAPFRASTANVDLEISDQYGPCLQVPATLLKPLLEAANARWGSLYQALYNSEAIALEPGLEPDAGHNPQRAAHVVVRTREWLDSVVPLATGSHVDARHYRIINGQLTVTRVGGEQTGLQHPQHYLGFQGDPRQPSAILLRHHGLHLQICLAAQSRAGVCDVAGISDVLLEAAVSVLVDTGTALDRFTIYRHWLALMQGDLYPAGELAADRHYQAAGGGELRLPGRALLLLRVNGLHRYCPVMLDAHGQAIPALILDTLLGSLIALHDLQRRGNSRTGSVYLLVPYLQGPQETAFVNLLFERLETLLELPPHTLKAGLIDQHWRTTLNLEACVQAVAARLAWLGTDPLPCDASVDTDHSVCVEAVQQRNRLVGLACGLRGRAQLGSTEPAGSPMAATLQALDYHRIDYAQVLRELEQQDLLPPCAALLERLVDMAQVHSG